LGCAAYTGEKEMLVACYIVDQQLFMWPFCSTKPYDPNFFFLFPVLACIRMGVLKLLQMIRETELLLPMWHSHLMVRG